MFIFGERRVIVQARFKPAATVAGVDGLCL